VRTNPSAVRDTTAHNAHQETVALVNAPKTETSRATPRASYKNRLYSLFPPFRRRSRGQPFSKSNSTAQRLNCGLSPMALSKMIWGPGPHGSGFAGAGFGSSTGIAPRACSSCTGRTTLKCPRITADPLSRDKSRADVECKAFIFYHATLRVSIHTPRCPGNRKARTVGLLRCPEPG